jgi:capsular polysaccharide transport system permease protein
VGASLLKTAEASRVRVRSFVDQFRPLAIIGNTQPEHARKKVVEGTSIEVRNTPSLRLSRTQLSFVLCTVIPALLTAIYLAVFASNEYVAEARFAVRSLEERSGLNDANTMLTALGVSRNATQDAFVVTNYIKSRTIIEDVGGKGLVRDIYARRNVDFLSRFKSTATLEEAWSYWRKKVRAVIDTRSGVIMLEVRAFTPHDAQRLAQLILERSELLVNQISERSRKDAVARAENEVKTAQERVQRAQGAVLEFRNKNNIINPASGAESVGKIIGELSREKLRLETELGSLNGIVSPDSPTQRLLTQRVANVDKQLGTLREKLTGSQRMSTVSGQIAEYEDLQLQVAFSEKTYSIAQSAYEKARMDQERQQIYLMTIVKPTLPEEAMFPRPVVSSSLVFISAFVFWSAVALFMAAVRDHIG